MELDRNGLEVLGRAESLRLLTGSSVGHLAVTIGAVTIGAVPVILPLHFVLDSDAFWSGRTKLDAATPDAVVAFEVDDVDASSDTGWSVCVTGRAREVTDRDDLAGISRLPLPHPPPGRGDRVVAMSTEVVSGHRIPDHCARERAVRTR